MDGWKLVESEPVLTSQWLKIDRNIYVTPTGLVPDYYIVTRDSFVLVVATSEDSVLLVRQYRPATDRFYLALPAGYIQSGESPEVAARREFFEETGERGINWHFVGELHPLPGYIHSSAYVFNCQVDLTGDRSSLLHVDPIEGTELVIVDRTRVREMIRTGEICEMQAVAAILLSDLL